MQTELKKKKIGRPRMNPKDRKITVNVCVPLRHEKAFRVKAAQIISEMQQCCKDN